ncbi:MAG: VOC family protein [Methylobacterium mesophilicum]|nr:VOC family protein [Methylobacterium mesophilicum]
MQTDPKTMAERLRMALGDRNIALSPAEALALVANQLGARDWNALAAAHDAADGAIRFTATKPILRIFDEAKAREFYLDFLGFTLDWEHRFGPHAPLYMQVSRAGLALHLSGHHGDATPGSTVFVEMRGVRAYHAELIARDYAYNRPGVEEAPWGDVLEVVDPFGSRIRFCEMGAS